MKSILIFTIAGILLLGCGDSKENKTAKAGMDTQITQRVIAQRYQVNTSDEYGAKCYPDISQREETINLRNGLQVALVTGNEVFVILDNIQWLHVYADSKKQQPCYIQTMYLRPVPSY
jgi:hypothetical protein